MASLNSDDCLLVGRDGVDYKVHYEDFVESLEGDITIESGLEEAPDDGEQYVRQNQSWQQVEIPEAGLEEAPNDGEQYVRQSESWQKIEIPGAGLEEAPENGTAYIRKDGGWVQIVKTEPNATYRGLGFTQVDNSMEAIGTKAHLTNSKFYCDAQYKDDQVFNVSNYGYLTINGCRFQIKSQAIEQGRLVVSHFGFCGGSSAIPGVGEELEVYNDSSPVPPAPDNSYRSFPEAPSDGYQYVRQAEKWERVDIGGSFPESPDDDFIYARDGKNKTWVKALPLDLSTLPIL